MWRDLSHAARRLARSPGMSGTTGSDPVLISTVSAVTVSRSPSAAVTLTVCGSVNTAWPVTTVAVSKLLRPS